MTLSAEHGFAQWLALGTIQEGVALAEQGQGVEGIAQIGEGLAVCQTLGFAMGRTQYLALLARVQGDTGQSGAGLHTLDEALTQMEKTGERFYAAELYRLQGELLWHLATPDSPQPEACFHQALAIARRQQAKSWELRAATSLARLWQQQGQRAEAYELLAPVYDWFTEGFDTADFQEAKALLQELS
jgi:predicted ATPase